MKDKVRTNRRIRVPRVQLIDQDNENKGVVDTSEALRMAENNGLDLVEVAPKARPPVCKIMNYGKFKYLQKKKQKNNKTKQKKTKSIKLNPNIAKNDLNIALSRAEKFLNKGNKVSVQVNFNRKHMRYGQVLEQHTDRGEELLKAFLEKFKETSKIESKIRLEGRNMRMLLAPISNGE